MKKIILLLSSLFFAFAININTIAQDIFIEGKVHDHSTREPLMGASVYPLGSTLGTMTDKAGYFSFSLPSAERTLIISYVGYETDSLRLGPGNHSDISIELKRNTILFPDAVIVGSRSFSHSSGKLPFPVDQFPAAELQSSGQHSLSAELNALAPSFYSTGLTYSDATDHMDPATLRGLNPDQTLILVNGKRHHPSAVVNVLSVVGRGAVINDLNTIPSAAIERIEILRDGASAQYGSDAIAGVINIVLKKDTSRLQLKTSAGQYYRGDGLTENFSANYGLGIGAKGGYINFTTAFNKRKATNTAGIFSGLIYRGDGEDGLSFEENLVLDNQLLNSSGLSRDDFRLHLGNSAMSNANLYFNSSIPIGKTSEIYSFGGINSRFSKSFGDYRLPNDYDRGNLSIYPNGFLPEIDARLNDRFISTGARTRISGWDIDLSNSFGSNSISFYVENSLNASMGKASPKSFESGGSTFRQNTVNLDFKRKFSDFWFFRSVGFAAGSEFRLENYMIIAGEEASYINEDKKAYPGAQGFPGYQLVDEVDRSRYNVGFYGELSLELSKRILVELAGRYEDYSDFGDNFSGKAAVRYNLLDILSLRGSVSSGFRAPSLHQKYYSNTGSYYFGGNLFEILTAPNNSRLAEAFGIPELHEESSLSYNLGTVFTPSSNTFFSLDVYQVGVKDRIVLSSVFYAFNPAVANLLLDFPDVGGVQFFTNAIDTRNQGVDIVFKQKFFPGRSPIQVKLGLNVNETKIVGNIKSSEKIDQAGLEDLVFDRQARALMEVAQPKSKLHLGLSWDINRFHLNLSAIRFGDLSYRGIDESPSELQRDQNYGARWISNVFLSYRFGSKLTINIGANNVLDVYPEKNNEVLQNFGRFPYNTAVTQFGFNGGYYYMGLVFSI